MFAWILKIAESPVNRIELESMDHRYYLNTVWACIVTMTTVGYGDMYPRTQIGRFIMVCCSIFGVVNVSLMVVTIQNSLDMNSSELQSYTVLKKLEYRNKLQNEALNLIVHMNSRRKRLKAQRENKIKVLSGFEKLISD